MDDLAPFPPEAAPGRVYAIALRGNLTKAAQSSSSHVKSPKPAAKLLQKVEVQHWHPCFCCSALSKKETQEIKQSLQQACGAGHK